MGLQGGKSGLDFWATDRPTFNFRQHLPYNSSCCDFNSFYAFALSISRSLSFLCNYSLGCCPLNFRARGHSYIMSAVFGWEGAYKAYTTRKFALVYEAYWEKTCTALISLHPHVVDHAYMPHLKAMYVPFHLLYGSLICYQRLQSDRPK